MSSNATVKACMRCRAVKMKCRAVLGTTTCERCTRKSFECIFHQKKRGRKTGTKLYQTRQLEPSTQDLRQGGSSNPDPGVTTSRSSSSEQIVTGSPANKIPSFSALKDNTKAGTWTESETLQPPGLFRNAMRGKFSLENILCTNHECFADSMNFTSNAAPTYRDSDPIERGLISYYVATSLFHGFMRNLNPLICVLDVSLHTFQYVQERSPFLFTVILSAAAKAFNPNLYPKLYRHSEDLYLDSLRRGTKSAEVVQAILIFTYWKKADDARSWAAIGYAIRLCMELGWHKLTMISDEDNASKPRSEALERRNIERTWLVLFIHDRGSSFQTGKPWMIERSDFIESVNSWNKHYLSTSNDAAVCALATLRLATADIVDVLNPQRPYPATTQSHRVSSSLRMLKPQLEAWEKHWSRVTDSEPCHKFIVSFYANHIRLFLYSFSLEVSLLSHPGGALMDNEAFWVTHTSALEMLKAVTHTSMSPLLSFVHDAIHVMVAYAAVFLIKLLLSVHQHIRKEVESSILDTIRTSAQVFELQATPATFGCTLQAKFLKNIVLQYEKARRSLPPTPRGSSGSKDGSGFSRATEQNGMLPDGQDCCVSSTTHFKSSFEVEVMRPRSASGTNVDDRTCPNLRGNNNNMMSDSMAFLNPYSFDDDRMWEATFMDAGFHVGDGVFLPATIGEEDMY